MVFENLERENARRTWRVSQVSYGRTQFGGGMNKKIFLFCICCGLLFATSCYDAELTYSSSFLSLVKDKEIFEGASFRGFFDSSGATFEITKSASGNELYKYYFVDAESSRTATYKDDDDIEYEITVIGARMTMMDASGRAELVADLKDPDN